MTPIDELLDCMAFADAIRSCRGKDMTAAEVDHAFARLAALRVAEAESDPPVVAPRLQ
jgi:hypothetical protein